MAVFNVSTLPELEAKRPSVRVEAPPVVGHEVQTRGNGRPVSPRQHQAVCLCGWQSDWGSHPWAIAEAGAHRRLEGER